MTTREILYSTLFLILSAFATLCFALGMCGCGGSPKPRLVVVSAEPPLMRVEALRLVVEAAGERSLPLDVPIAGGAADVPPARTISIDVPRAGRLRVLVEAMRGGRVIASAAGEGEGEILVVLPGDSPALDLAAADRVDAGAAPDLSADLIESSDAEDLARGPDLSSPDLLPYAESSPDLLPDAVASSDLTSLNVDLARPDLARPDLAPPRGTFENPGATCLDILRAGIAVDGVYWIAPGGGARRPAYCDMTTDGGGWTVCARQSFAQDGRYLGNTALTTTWGTPHASLPHGIDCTGLARAVRPGGNVELALRGSAGEWQWIWPLSTENFWAHLKGDDDTSCDGPDVTECRGSATGGKTVAVKKRQACHSTGQHRTGDSYFVYQVADAINTNVLLEIGQGDNAHPVGIRMDCLGSGYWGGCGTPGGQSAAYAVPSQCGAQNRAQGVATVMFRER